jgi:glycosyltransferase involved in cell wall biosynthesis
MSALAETTRGASLPISRQLPERIAVVHDWLPEVGGAERVLGEILKMLPQAHLYSLLDFLPESERSFLGGRKVRTSFLQGLPGAKRFYRSYLPLMPLAVEHFDLAGYDMVLSSSYAVAKGVITGPDQLHLCYCHSPPRYAWDLQEVYLRQSRRSAGLTGFIARALLHYIRLWDCRTPNGVDAFAANSRFIQRRIWKVYRRRSSLIYPPVPIVDETGPLCERPRTRYLSLGRLVPYKRVDLLLETFRRLPRLQLEVIGDGPERSRLERSLPANVRFLGRQPQRVVSEALRSAKALLFAAEEDFGLVPVEAQAAGTPVIAYAKGGAAESVLEGVTGVLFHEQTVEALIDAMERADGMYFDPAALRQNAMRFSAETFRSALGRWLVAEWSRFRIARGPRELNGERALFSKPEDSES